jgi:hypothetical protein
LGISCCGTQEHYMYFLNWQARKGWEAALIPRSYRPNYKQVSERKWNYRTVLWKSTKGPKETRENAIKPLVPAQAQTRPTAIVNTIGEPATWVEDNTFRRQRARERPPVAKVEKAPPWHSESEEGRHSTRKSKGEVVNDGFGPLLESSWRKLPFWWR